MLASPSREPAPCPKSLQQVVCPAQTWNGPRTSRPTCRHCRQGGRLTRLLLGWGNPLRPGREAVPSPRREAVFGVGLFPSFSSRLSDTHPFLLLGWPGSVSLTLMALQVSLQMGRRGRCPPLRAWECELMGGHCQALGVLEQERGSAPLQRARVLAGPERPASPDVQRASVSLCG